ncbi:Transmembrane protein 62 [Hordeum vulgare]|uniref:Calcineurin-like phosphoesterase domain-containing protein n=1 Tax=Hordeum vulgare subsp. vulgare TaxID=112509 RepID=A0A8I7B676_HORVV|nr:putative metallophosphoesterase At3g03305 [Hordeum vulgare subsp. vulgare]KAE8808932.1 Transmembrane protein 62 [Hordeum vulgare]
MGPRGNRLLPILLALVAVAGPALPSVAGDERAVAEVSGAPEGVMWVAQLSDLHFSVHHPERAYDFRRYVGPALAMVNPDLVFITGDLTEGKSKDLLTMKQNEVEWMEYSNTMKDVIESSKLPRKKFYDLRGNHDRFGVPVSGGDYDFYEKYSMNANLRRQGRVQSITLENNGRKHLFVGFDSTMEIGLRGPTNLFGHPTDKQLIELDQSLSQWDTDFNKAPVTKVTVGHFPMSFSTLTESGKSIKDVFLKHSLAAYLCGHLHTRFGKNLKRYYHRATQEPSLYEHYYQSNMHQGYALPSAEENCSEAAARVEEFWEWEIGDWKRSRSMRILAIDDGHVSFTDIDFRLGSKSVIILPTFPLDSRFMQRRSAPRDFKCHTMGASTFDTVRALVFSRHEIVTVSAKIYDSRPGNLEVVFDSEMKRVSANDSRGDMYLIPWNWRAFADPSPDRYWLQIEAMDITGDISVSQLRPFSVNGLFAKVSWTWKEFFVMGIQWASVYHPALQCVLALIFTLLLVPRASLVLLKDQQSAYSYLRVDGSQWTPLKYLLGGFIWLFVELSRMILVWSLLLVYIIYLLVFPWFSGHPVTEDSSLASMTFRGWALKSGMKTFHAGTPDVMVIVLPHLCFVVLPTIVILAAMAAERTAFREHYLSQSGKKKDDHHQKSRREAVHDSLWSGRWIRKILIALCLVVLWKHWKLCRALMKAYAMDPLLHSPVLFYFIPALMAFAIYRTSSI